MKRRQLSGRNCSREFRQYQSNRTFCNWKLGYFTAMQVLYAKYLRQHYVINSQ